MTREHFCTACGHRLGEGHSYCTQCGTPLLPPVPRRPLFVDEQDGQDGHNGHEAASGPREQAAAAPGAAATAAGPVPASVAEQRPATTAVSRRTGRRRSSAGWAMILAGLLLLIGAAAGYLLGDREDAATAAGPATQAPAAGGAPGRAQPQDRLQQISRADEARVARLVGSWVPQLAAVTPGAGGDDSWAEALTHYQDLKSEYPTALLVDTGAWPHSYERGGMYAVLVPETGDTPDPALSWCATHRYSKDEDCAAKLIETSGSWADNFRSGEPS